MKKGFFWVLMFGSLGAFTFLSASAVFGKADYAATVKEHHLKGSYLECHPKNDRDDKLCTVTPAQLTILENQYHGTVQTIGGATIVSVPQRYQETVIKLFHLKDCIVVHARGLFYLFVVPHVS